jgi:hypothetical protein
VIVNHDKEESMAAKIKNAGTAWSDEEVRELKKLAKGNTPTRVIGLKLGRSPAGVYAKARQSGISLRPANQRPYGSTAKWPARRRRGGDR